jgi:hypothetical protein
MMSSTKRTKTSDLDARADAIVSAKCPACGLTTTLHAESIAIGAEILCCECYAVLRIDRSNPLTLAEVEDEDLL